MICYLCGEKLIDTDVTNEDHVPQKGFFLTKNPPGIIKLITHEKCNSGFSNDEQYIITTIRGTSNWDLSARNIWETRGLISITKQSRSNLLNKILGETILLHGNYIQNIEKDRLIKVLDKIVRGLYFKEFNKTIESNGIKIDPEEFIHRQEINGWQLDKSSFVSIGTAKNEEFSYLKKETDEHIEYFLFFYNVHFFRLLYKID